MYLAVTIFAIGNTALLNYLMGSRLLFGMSRQGLMPPVLGKLHPIRRTPSAAIVVLFVIVTVLILSGGVKPLAEATVLLLLTVFTIVNVSLIVLKRRPGEATDGFDVPLLVPILGALVCALLIVVRIEKAIASRDAAQSTAPLIALAVFALSLVLYTILKPKNPIIED